MSHLSSLHLLGRFHNLRNYTTCEMFVSICSADLVIWPPADEPNKHSAHQLALSSLAAQFYSGFCCKSGTLIVWPVKCQYDAYD